MIFDPPTAVDRVTGPWASWEPDSNDPTGVVVSELEIFDDGRAARRRTEVRGDDEEEWFTAQTEVIGTWRARSGDTVLSFSALDNVRFGPIRAATLTCSVMGDQLSCDHLETGESTTYERHIPDAQEGWELRRRDPAVEKKKKKKDPWYGGWPMVLDDFYDHDGRSYDVTNSETMVWHPNDTVERTFTHTIESFADTWRESYVSVGRNIDVDGEIRLRFPSDFNLQCELVQERLVCEELRTEEQTTWRKAPVATPYSAFVP